MRSRWQWSAELADGAADEGFRFCLCRLQALGGALLGVAVFQQGCDQAFPVIYVRGDGHAAVFDIDTDAADTIEFLQGMGDNWGSTEDVSNMADATPRAQEILFVSSTHRFDGYQYLVDNPGVASAFFKHYLNPA